MLTLRLGGEDVDSVVAAGEMLEDMAAVLAIEPSVSGVETRSPEHARVQRPELVLYTTPDALETLRVRAAEVAGGFQVQVSMHEEVRDDENWRDAWKQHYRKLYFGPQGAAPADQAMLMVRPSWIDREPGDPPLEVVLDPGRAFGTGLHETTRLCLARLCALAAEGVRPGAVLDLGSGSGILALAALRLWPDLPQVTAVDIDEEATETIVENAAANELGGRVQVRTGELGAAPRASWDLVLANIRPEVLVPLAGPLRNVMAADGRVIVSGVLLEEGERVSAAFTEAGWVLDPIASGGRRMLGEWIAFDLRASA